MIEHTKEPWKAEEHARWIIRSPHHVYGLAETTCHQMHYNEHAANARLIALAPTAPHECADLECPGNVNRRKLAAFDGLLAFTREVADGRHYWDCDIWIRKDCTCSVAEAKKLLAKTEVNVAIES